MSNPYQSPTLDPLQPQKQQEFSPAAASNHRWVSQVRIFAILNAIQGVLEVLMGIFSISMAVVFPILLKSPPTNPGPGAPPAGTFVAISIIYCVMGVPVLISGVLRMLAAVQNYRFRGRTLGMISAIAGIGSMLSCYCAPTAIGLVIYGLIVSLHPAVKAAFEMAQQGYTADQILAVFSPYSSAAQPGAPSTLQSPFGEQQ